MRGFALLLLLVAPAAAWAYWQQQPAPDTGTAPPEPTGPDTLDEPTFLESIGIAIMNATRGERNNNPGNIIQSASNWLGKITGTDSRFESFDTPVNGIRALAKLLKKYQAQGFNTVRKIITKYAPASENNTAAYVKAVAASMGVGPDQVLTLDAGQLNALVTAIIKHENGRVIYSAADIASAVQLA